VTVYRVEGPGNERLELTVGRLSSAQLSIGGGTNQLYLNFGDRSRAVDFLGKRYSQGHTDDVIKRFDVDQSYLDRLRIASVPQSQSRQSPGRPVRVDEDAARDQFAFKAELFAELVDQAIVAELFKEELGAE